MRITGRTGPYFEIIEAPSPEDPTKTVKLGVRYDTFRHKVRLGLGTWIASYYQIVRYGLMDAKHVFRGLERPLMHDGDMEADGTVIIYSWRPSADWEWRGDGFSGYPVRLPQPSNRVFVVLVKEDKSREFGVYGSIEEWNWIMEDTRLKDAPVEWDLRYEEKIWSR